MSDYVTDTHGLIWYLEDSLRLGVEAKAAFDACDRGVALIYVPTICLVELVYLCEKGRVPWRLWEQFHAALLTEATGLRVTDLTVSVVDALSKISRDAVPDMPDRIIAATALDLGLPLISRDRKIVSAALTTLW